MAMDDQIPRQWRILRRLETHRYGLSANDMAGEEGCPVRTIYRDLADLEESSGQQLQALTINLAELEARMTRLDALGQHLTTMADLEEGEFDFSEPPALGGPLSGGSDIEFTSGNFDGELGRFEVYISNRERQLEMLESLLTNRKLEQQGFWIYIQPEVLEARASRGRSRFFVESAYFPRAHLWMCHEWDGPPGKVERKAPAVGHHLDHVGIPKLFGS